MEIIEQIARAIHQAEAGIAISDKDWAGMDGKFKDRALRRGRAAHSVIAGKVAELEKALVLAAESLEGLSSWRDDARAHDDDMGHEQREFCDDEDWDMAEQAASRAAAKARAALAPYPERRHE